VTADRDRTLEAVKECLVLCELNALELWMQRVGDATTPHGTA
jgi:hypothetical protein